MPGLSNPAIWEVIRCPACRGPLFERGDELHCHQCGQTYAVEAEIPVLFHARSEFARLRALGRPAKPVKPHSPFSLTRLPLARFLDGRFFAYINQCTPDMLLLNLGSGDGLFDAAFRPDLRLVNLDIYRNARTDIMADAHYLPFADGSFDGVITNAVFEHVRKPWIIADELWRILRPGGRIFINVPFLNVIHDERDYYRYTDRALETLIDRFEKIDCRVSAGPGSFLGPFLVEYLACFFPDGILRRVARQPLTLLAWPLQYIDVLVRRSNHLRVTADAFYFIGAKLDSGSEAFA